MEVCNLVSFSISDLKKMIVPKGFPERHPIDVVVAENKTLSLVCFCLFVCLMNSTKLLNWLCGDGYHLLSL